MASENSSTSAGQIVPVTGVNGFQINMHVIFYVTINHMIDSGIRLLETTAEYGNDEVLIKTFRQLLPFGVNEKLLLIEKLTPVGEHMFHARDFDKTIINLQMNNYLHVFLIHYPALPKYNAKNSMNISLQTQTWMAVSRCDDQRKFNAFGVCKLQTISVTHAMQLTEVVAVGPMVSQMDWFSYYNFSYTERTISNLDLVKNPLVESLAERYGVSAAGILVLWTLQRGETILPRITTSGFVTEPINLNIRLSQHDLSSLDVLAVSRNNPFHSLLFNN